MKPFAIAAALALSLAIPVRAEHQVKLKSGATLVGDAKFDGDAIVIDIDGAANRIPLADIESITSTKFGEQREAQRLLLRALESRLASTSAKDAVPLLAEAAQLDPENPHIAYWFATNLVEAGYGKIARTKFENLRAAIEEAYPDGAARLASRIERRVTIEALPADLVARIDEFNAAAAAGIPDPNNPHMKRMAAVFRVLDQDNDPVDQSAIQMQGNGGQEKLEQFADGYYFYSVFTGNNEQDQQCRVVVSKSGLKRAEQQLNVSSREAAMGRQIAVHRFADGDKRPARVVVAGRDGEPLAGIRVQLQPNQGNSEPLVATTDDEGAASFTAFPGAYGLYAEGSGYNPLRGQIQIDEQNPQGAEQRLVLHRAVSGSIRLEWQTKSWQGGAETTSGSTTLQPGPIDGGGYFGGDTVANAFRLGQVEDKLVLQIMRYNYGGPPPASGTPIKRLKFGDDVPADERHRHAEEQFESLDVAGFDQLGDEFVTAPTEGVPQSGQGSVRIDVRPGDVIVGRTTGRDMRTGQPLEVTFKAFVESSDNAGGDDLPESNSPPAQQAPAPIAPAAFR